MIHSTPIRSRAHLSALAAALLLTVAGASAPATSSTPTMPSKSTPSKSPDPRMTHYLPYSKAAFDAARGMQRVLFFHATWCPNCKAADADIVRNLGKIPGDVVIFKTDYDREVALKKQYGITSQHTFVLVDGEGKALKKWAGGQLSTIISKTQTDATPPGKTPN